VVLDDFFSGEYNEEQLRVKHHLRRGTFRRWLNNELFYEEFERCVRASQLRGAAKLACYSQSAASKLDDLTRSENSETARKACLDIIRIVSDKSMQSAAPSMVKEVEESNFPLAKQISEEKASQLLAILAE
jgi:hypothetical protein